MALVPFTLPTQGPVTLADAKTQLRVTYSDEDAFIQNLVNAATKYAEDFMRRGLSLQSSELWLEGVPPSIIFPIVPLMGVLSIQYYNASNVLSTLAGSTYVVDTKSEPGMVVPAYGQTWPDTFDRPNSVRIVFEVGYPDSTFVPKQIKQAILILVTHWHENRGNVTTPSAVDDLLQPYRLSRF